MVYPKRIVPTFKGWTDQLLRDRQTEDITRNRFGQGDLVLHPADNAKEDADYDEVNQGDMQQDDHGSADEGVQTETGEGRGKTKRDGRRRTSKRKPQTAPSDTESGGEDMEEVSSLQLFSSQPCHIEAPKCCRCHGGATVVTPWCHSGATVVPQW